MPRTWRTHPVLRCWIQGYVLPVEDICDDISRREREMVKHHRQIDRWMQYAVMEGKYTSEGSGFPPGTLQSCWCLSSPHCRTAGTEAELLELNLSGYLAFCKTQERKQSLVPSVRYTRETMNTNLFMSTVVTLKVTPLSHKTMKSR